MTDQHRFYLDSIDGTSGNTLRIDGEEARHATRVKRLQVGDRVGLLDGRGLVASGTLLDVDRRGSPAVLVRVESSEHLDPPLPRVHVVGATPKGRRVDDMIDGLSQAGACSWRPLRSEHAVVDPRDTKIDRLTRIAIAASKQCRRAWLMELARTMSLDEALGAPPDGPETAIVVADASGTPYRAGGADDIRLIIGPEGGLSAEELDLARGTGATIARFGRHTMRIETAAVVATGLVIDHEERLRTSG